MSRRRSAPSRAHHPQYIEKRPVRVKVRLISGRNLIGDCHVVVPDGRVSDVVNDTRRFLVLTDVSVEDDQVEYDVIAVSKDTIEMVLEIQRDAP